MEHSGWILLAVFVVLGLVSVFRMWRRISAITTAVEAVYAPPRELVAEVREAIRWTQMEAADNAVFVATAERRSPEEILSRLTPAVLEAQSRTIADAARLTYAIEWNQAGYLHVLSASDVGPGKDDPQRYAVDRSKRDSTSYVVPSIMHVALLILAQQVEDAGIEVDADEHEGAQTSQSFNRFASRPPQPSASSFGFLLDPAQHEAFMAVDPPWPPGIPDR